ncbi:ABC transporter substrate-binding protein [Paenibacillus tengchongensis]|uniref:ABC transporter substrate-binding protein n=1 Tax=Paenibacillus tengchongensis TaxID=2608684 RepID=UPI00124ED156|nr:extracellular solute-binding protein [Paenibacillus tengchongensis]
MLKRKNYWMLFIILMLALTSLSPSIELDTGIGSNPQHQPLNPLTRTDSGEQEIPVLNIRVSLSGEEFQELTRISNNYTLSTGVQVLLSNTPADESLDALKEELTTGASPDIVMTAGRNIPALATRGYLLPVDVYRSVPGSAPLTALIPQMQWNGYDWGVPLDVDPYVLVYSKTRLSELGLEQAPRGLEQWTTLLGRLLEDTGKDRYLLSMDSQNPYGYSLLLESMGLSLEELSDEALVWTEQARSYFYLTGKTSTAIWDMLDDGTLALAAVPVSEWRRHGNATMAAEAPAETGNGQAYEAMDSRFFALPAESGNPEAAVDWLGYMTSSAAQLEWLRSTERLPALDELYRSGLPRITWLPFRTSVLLADETAASALSGDGEAIAAAVSQLLTGKLDAAGFKERISGDSLE